MFIELGVFQSRSVHDKKYKIYIRIINKLEI